jgi:hypothetical protein
MRESADFQRWAEEYVRRAQETSSPEQKALLIEMAQAWLRLARQAESNEPLAKDGDVAL